VKRPLARVNQAWPGNGVGQPGRLTSHLSAKRTPPTNSNQLEGGVVSGRRKKGKEPAPTEPLVDRSDWLGSGRVSCRFSGQPLTETELRREIVKHLQLLQ
jgi:hypothetical protein